MTGSDNGGATWLRNHVGIDRLRRCTVVHAAAYDGGQLCAILAVDNVASGE